jgi:hypothetical protein
MLCPVLFGVGLIERVYRWLTRPAEAWLDFEENDLFSHRFKAERNCGHTIWLRSDTELSDENSRFTFGVQSGHKLHGRR